MSSHGNETLNKITVVFKEGTAKAVIDKAIKDVEKRDGKVTQRFDAAPLGFSAEVPNAAVQQLDVAPGVIKADGK